MRIAVEHQHINLEMSLDLCLASLATIGTLAGQLFQLDNPTNTMNVRSDSRSSRHNSHVMDDMIPFLNSAIRDGNHLSD